MDPWQTILLAVGGNAAFLAVLGWLGKSLLDKLIVRETKQFESDLKAKTDAAIEQLKSDLQIRSIEHQVRFSKLHEKRAVVIAELYEHVVVALREAESFLSPMEWAGEPNKKEKYREAINKLVDLYRFFDKHQIYLPNQLCANLEGLVKATRWNVTKFGVWVDYNDASLSPQSVKEKLEAWDTAWDALQKEVKLARTALENEFRSLLGALERP